MDKKLPPPFENFEARAAAAQARLNDFKAVKLKPGDPHAVARSRRTAKIFTKPSKTVRSQAYETDLNRMVQGLTPFTQHKQPGYYIDETLLPLNYEDQFNMLQDAQAAFMQLPPDVRERFHNNPAILARALGDPRQQEALRELGVIAPLPPSPPSPERPSTASSGPGTGPQNLDPPV